MPPIHDRETVVTQPLIADEARETTLSAEPVEAMWLEELERTRIFMKVIVGIVLAIYAASPWLGGDPAARRLFLGGATLGLVSALVLLWDLRKAENYTIARLLIGGLIMASCAWTGVFYFGVYSPAPAIFILGLYYFSLGAASAATSAIFVTVVVLQGATAILIELGVIVDPGRISADAMTSGERLALQFLVQVLLVCAFVMARMSRRTTMRAVSRLERAVKQVAQREALLHEARQDLDRALRIGGPGRYSGQRVGSYALGHLIGRGGMGEVYEAHHVETNELAAVKLLNAQAAHQPEQVTRFVREANTAKAIVSRHVVSVLEVGHTDGQVPFLAMERLDGHDLGHHLRQHKRLDPLAVELLVAQVAAGLVAAAQVGVVHRDLKPQNLFLDEATNQWKILDFGVSKWIASDATLTKGRIVGTPGYMAPEQARSESVDHRADVYALGVIAYRALTGHPAFAGRDVPSTLYDVVYRMPVAPSAHAQLPPDLDLFFAVALAKRPADRFQSAEAFQLAFSAALAGRLSDAVRERAERLLSEAPFRSPS